jgi:SAM-dependent methyltransferase
MPYHVDIVVLSNLSKDWGPNVDVVVGLPQRNPYTLPFGHKNILSERVNDYDLFIYSEDDILISRRNIDAFLAATQVLHQNELAGFVMAETGADGTQFFDVLHSFFHWDPSSVGVRGEYTVAQCTNEHSACFILTQEQLRRAIASGGFLVRPHVGKYDLREAAATDPYTQCGFRKMMCVSHLQEFTVLHLPNNKCASAPWEIDSVFRQQIRSLLDLEKSGYPSTLLIDPETKVPLRRWSKSYYEPCRMDMVSLIPSGARRLLSLGCGFGYTEEHLVKQGIRVVGLPLDSVIAACAEDKGVEVVHGSFETAREKLVHERFDCLLVSNMLHLVPCPVEVLRSFTQLLAPGGTVIVGVPNFSYLPTVWYRLWRHPHFRDLGDYQRSGLHTTTKRIVRDWFRRSDLKFGRVVWPEPAPDLYPPQLGPLQHVWRRARRRLWRLAAPVMASELIAMGTRVKNDG